MTDPRISASTSRIQLLSLHQDDQIAPAPRGLAAQVHVSHTPVVPYHFGSSDEQAKKLQGLLKHLQDDATKLGKMNHQTHGAEYARAHMALEGKILRAAPEASYKQVQQYLATLGHHPHPELSGQSELEALNRDLAEYLTKNEEAAQQDGGFQAVFDKHVGRVGDTLGFYHSLYDKALEGASVKDQAHIRNSRTAFNSYAAGIAKQINEELPSLMSKFFDSRIAHAHAAVKDTSRSETERAVAQDELSQLKKVRADFSLLWVAGHANPTGPTDLQKATKANENLNTSLNNIGRDKYVGKLKAEANNPVIAGRIFAGQGVPQGGASYLHFGYTRSGIDKRMDDIGASFLGHVAATGVGLGTAHKVVSDAVRPFIQLVMDQSIGLNVAKADPLKVYPKALKVVAGNDGQRVANPNRDAQNTIQTTKRTEYKTMQNANYFGTMSGDFTGFTAFGGAHGVRDLLDQFTALNAGSVHARALFSGIGGTAMAGAQAVAKYSQAHGDEKIPTHSVVKDTRDFSKALGDTFRAVGIQLDPTKMGTYNDLAGRILSLGEGVAMSTALAKAAGLGDEPSVRKKVAHVVATYFQSGLTLQPFFANNQAAAENKALNGGRDNPATRAQVPWQNLRHPDRTTLAHSQPIGTKARLAENITQHVLRGVTQAVPQLIIAGVNAAADKIGDSLSSINTDTTGLELRRAEEGLRRRKKAGPKDTR